MSIPVFTRQRSAVTNYQVGGFFHELTVFRDSVFGFEIEIEALHDAGDKVVAVARTRGLAKATGMAVELSIAMVWTLRGGRQTRMEMYADPAEALKAVGLAE